ncbi:MAG: hypothetical protein KC766_33900, partial [Myxococcales bacterium]|nr:hypothetical protein [Myxococcales bacterium]
MRSWTNAPGTWALFVCGALTLSTLLASSHCLAQSYGPVARLLVTRGNKAEGRATFVTLNEAQRNLLPDHCRTPVPLSSREAFLLTALHVLTSWHAAERGRPASVQMMLGSAPDIIEDVSNDVELCLTDQRRDIAVARIVSSRVPPVRALAFGAPSSARVVGVLSNAAMNGQTGRLRLGMVDRRNRPAQ